MYYFFTSWVMLRITSLHGQWLEVYRESMAHENDFVDQSAMNGNQMLTDGSDRLVPGWCSYRLTHGNDLSSINQYVNEATWKWLSINLTHLTKSDSYHAASKLVYRWRWAIVTVSLLFTPKVQRKRRKRRKASKTFICALREKKWCWKQVVKSTVNTKNRLKVFIYFYFIIY